MTTAATNHPIDVTNSHVLVGYKPVCVLLPVEEFEHLPEEVCLSFGAGPFRDNTMWRGLTADRSSVAKLQLRKADLSSPIAGWAAFVAVHGEHSFLNVFHRTFNAMRERFQRRKNDNVNLPGNLHDQVRIAYSVPRKIALITVGNTSSMNMFPTDLHGHLGALHYAGSLRIGGKASHQVETAGRIVVTEMPAAAFDVVYRLGKNHMRGMASSQEFAIATKPSPAFAIPVPVAGLRFMELQRVTAVDIGIHRVHFYEKVLTRQLSEGESLSHIHQYYAQWRLTQGQPTNMLLRG